MSVEFTGFYSGKVHRAIKPKPNLMPFICSIRSPALDEGFFRFLNADGKPISGPLALSSPIEVPAWETNHSFVVLSHPLDTTGFGFFNHRLVAQKLFPQHRQAPAFGIYRPGTFDPDLKVSLSVFGDVLVFPLIISNTLLELAKQ
jgi:hypothetical protein